MSAILSKAKKAEALVVQLHAQPCRQIRLSCPRPTDGRWSRNLGLCTGSLRRDLHSDTRRAGMPKDCLSPSLTKT